MKSKTGHMMKIKYILLAAFILVCQGQVRAQSDTTPGNIPPIGIIGEYSSDDEDGLRKIRSYVGIHTGLDMGGSAPLPLSKLGKSAKVNVAPGLMPQLGGSWRIEFDDRWSLGAEATYKKVSLDINAWVPGQRYRDKDNEGLYVIFRGSTRIDMSYSMLEVPLYAGYSFGPLRNNCVFFGFYYAWMINRDFKIYPTKGVITSSTGITSAITPDSPYTQDFNHDLKSWDWGIVAGYERSIIDRLSLGVRFSMGCTDVFRSGSNALDYSMYQLRGSIVLSYQLFRINYNK